MADFNLVMPKLGESIQEATITKWLIKPGDMVEEDDVLLEIATDKVDSEIPSPVAGKVLKVLYAENALVPVGEVIAIINTEGKGEVTEQQNAPAASGELSTSATQPADGAEVPDQGKMKDAGKTEQKLAAAKKDGDSSRFYSPLVMSIAAKGRNFNSGVASGSGIR